MSPLWLLNAAGFLSICVAAASWGTRPDVPVDGCGAAALRLLAISDITLAVAGTALLAVPWAVMQARDTAVILGIYQAAFLLAWVFFDATLTPCSGDRPLSIVMAVHANVVNLTALLLNHIFAYGLPAAVLVQSPIYVFVDIAKRTTRTETYELMPL